MSVPRAAFRFAAARRQRAVAIPVVASNRINTPELAEEIVASGDAAMVSMARPFLADPAFVQKAAEGRADQINTCIACNQACLDYIFTDRPATCLVNPQAGRELEFAALPAPTRSKASPSSAPVRPGWRARSRRPSAAMRSRCSRPKPTSAAR